MFHHLAHLLSQFCQFTISPDGGTAQIQVNPTQLSDQMDHPVFSHPHMMSCSYLAPSGMVSLKSPALELKKRNVLRHFSGLHTATRCLRMAVSRSAICHMLAVISTSRSTSKEAEAAFGSKKRNYIFSRKSLTRNIQGGPSGCTLTFVFC